MAAVSGALEPEHRPEALLYPAMVLLDQIVQVLAGAHLHPARQGSNFFQFGHRPVRGGVTVQGNHPWGAVLSHRSGKEPLGRIYITPLAQEQPTGGVRVKTREETGWRLGMSRGQIAA